MVKLRLQPDALGVFAQDPRADGVERAGVGRRRGGGGLGAEIAPQQPLDAAVQLRRRAAGEGGEHDALGIGALQHEMGDAMGERVGLAGARAGDDEQRPLAVVLDGRRLRIVEAGVANQGGGHGGRVARLGFVRKGGVCYPSVSAGPSTAGGAA